MHKHIFFDARMINHTGIGTYIHSVLSSVSSWGEGIYLTVLLPKNFDVSFIKYPHVSFIFKNIKIYSIQEQFIIPFLIPSDCDLVWIPHFNIPFFSRHRLVCTVHDIIHISLPSLVRGGHFASLVVRLYFVAIKLRKIKIISVSEFTASELNSKLSISKSQIIVVPNLFFPLTKSSTEVNIVNGPYILAVGNLKKHKNLILLIKAFKGIKHKIPHKLVLIGKKSGINMLDTEVAELAEERIIFTGFVSDLQLRSYYGNAGLFVLPSLYEGFGYPPFEAASFGVPVLISNIPALREMSSEFSTTFELDVLDLQSKILGILESKIKANTVTADYFSNRNKQIFNKMNNFFLNIFSKVS